MRGKGKSAQAMIEMAMLAPMIFMLLIFVFDLARAAATWAAISEAVREGSRNSVLIGTGTAATDDSIVGYTKLFGVNLKSLEMKTAKSLKEAEQQKAEATPADEVAADA